MRVFLTGATGFIGSAVLRDLRDAGHTVLGLARSDATAETLAREGADAHRGDVTDPESLAAGARACDGVIHCAFIHDFAHYVRNTEIDRAALAAMAGALEGTGKPIVSTSGTAVLAPGRVGTEQDDASPDSPAHHRGASESVLASAARGVRASTIRLPPTVHGAGDHAFIPALVATARRTRVAAYVGDGANRWPAVHRLDAARLFRLALEGAAPGTRLHGVAEEGIPMRAIAEAIGAGLGVPVRGLTEAEAAPHFDWLVRFVAIDNPTSSAATRAALGWAPTGPGLLADMRDNGYFA